MHADLPPSPPALIAQAPASNALSIDSFVRFQADKPFTKAIHSSSQTRISLFALEPGQEIPQHAAKSEVLMFVHQGKGTFTVGDRSLEARAGEFIPVPFGLPHGFKAHERLVVYAVIAPNPAARGESEHRE